MNIFILDTDIENCALYHCNKHVNSQLKESVQILCTVLWKDGYEFGGVKIEDLKLMNKSDKMEFKNNCPIYLPTHINHPCVKWVCESNQNWVYVRHLGCLLHREWLRRFHYNEVDVVIHKSSTVLHSLPDVYGPNCDMTPFVQCMPDKYKVNTGSLYTDAVYAYRKYYLSEKKHILTWGPKSCRFIPPWVLQEVG